MKVLRVIEICVSRQQGEKPLSCRGCIYEGKTCEHVKKILKVKIPAEYYRAVIVHDDNE